MAYRAVVEKRCDTQLSRPTGATSISNKPLSLGALFQDSKNGWDKVELPDGLLSVILPVGYRSTSCFNSFLCLSIGSSAFGGRTGMRPRLQRRLHTAGSLLRLLGTMNFNVYLTPNALATGMSLPRPPCDTYL